MALSHTGLVGSHDRNLSISASRVFDILALYKLEIKIYSPGKIRIIFSFNCCMKVTDFLRLQTSRML